MYDYIEIGSTPPEEDCAQVGSDNYRQQALKECNAYKNQLQRIWPDGNFQVKAFQHDFGTYYEVVAWMGPTEVQENIAFEAEANGPMNWDDEARKELDGSTV